MRKSRLAFRVVLIGLILVVALAASAKRAGNYIGSSECAVCHEDTHPAIIKAHAKTLHHMAMTDVTKKPAAIVAKFEADSPFKKSEIRYVLGTGQVYQNYLDKNLKMLPGKWLVKEKKWAKVEAVDAVTQCVGCHTTNFDPATKTWSELGVGCESCHGPGGKHSESMEAKDIVNPKKLDSKKLDMICGQCHSTGTDLTGKYAFSPSFVPGNDLAKHMKLCEPSEGAANSQYNTFLTSKHESGGMNCGTCHDTHGDKAKAAHQLRKPINEQCLECHKMQLGDTKAVVDMKSHASTAAADATCASCHMQGGTHAFKKATTEQGRE